MNDKTAQLLFESPFSTLDDVERFVDWYNEEMQITSHWDEERYNWALLIMNSVIQ